MTFTPAFPEVNENPETNGPEVNEEKRARSIEPQWTNGFNNGGGYTTIHKIARRRK